MNEIKDLPKGWEIVKIIDIADILMGQSPPSETYNDEGIGLPFFQGKAEFTELYPIVRKWCNVSTKIAEPNDILMSVRAPVGSTNIANVQCCIGRGLAAIRYAECYKYLFYHFRLIANELDKKGTGTTFRAISGDILKNTEIPLPPLAEQHRIVAKIEELFSRLDKGVESLKAAQAQLKTYRQAVLKWAFEGKLANDKPSITNDELKMTNNENKDNPKNPHSDKEELPEGWEWKNFGNLFLDSPQNGIYKSNSDYGSGIKILRIDGFYDGVILHDYDYKRLKLTSEEIKKYSLEVDDIVVNRVNSMVYLGKCGIVRLLNETVVFESNIMRIKVNKEKALPNFLTLYLSSQNGLRELRKNAKQAVNQASINQTDVSNVEVPLPPTIKEQEKIVQEIESRLSVCDKIEEGILHSLKQAEALRQSILKKAFEGKLVAQNPEDEPAQVLLERIRAEKEANTNTKPPKTKK